MSKNQRVHYLDQESRRGFDNLVNSWIGCRGCPLHQTRTRVVHYRGVIPCQILFVGEAPGESEDALGYPFVGPAGQLMDKLVGGAFMLNKDEPEECRLCGRCSVSGNHCTACGCPYAYVLYGVTNIVACLPKTIEELSTGELRIPTKDEAMSCAPRLQQQIDLCKPKVIVTLGEIAKRYLTKGTTWKGPVYHMLHPAAILRNDQPSSQLLQEKRWMSSLSNVLKELEHASHS